MIYVLSIKISSNPDVYEIRGLYESEVAARGTILTGDFLVNRYSTGTAFSYSLVDAGQTGAVFFSRIASDDTVQDLAERVASLEADMETATTKILEIKSILK